MSRVRALLSKRLRKSEGTSKMTALAEESASGRRTGFGGIFSVSELNETEKGSIAAILESHRTGNQDVGDDLQTLISITSEVKAINNQAAILHGERIKRAQGILKSYSDGAFSEWLVSTYGNRQTPYNLLQYYEFYSAMPKDLRPQIESMPRQAVYTLASRDGDLEKKRQIVEDYDGQTKNELVALIREAFPLRDDDGRRQDIGESLIQSMKRLVDLLQTSHPSLSKVQKSRLLSLLKEVKTGVSSCEGK